MNRNIENKNGIIKALFSVSGLILISKLLGFLKQMYVAAIFGTSIETDVIRLAEGMIANTQYVLCQVLLTSFPVVYIQIQGRDKLMAKRFTMDTLKVFGGITAVLALLIIVAAKPIAGILAPSYSAELKSQVAYYLRLMSPVLVLFVFTGIFNALLNSNKEFIKGELNSVVNSLATVAVVFLLYRSLSSKALAVSVLMYGIANVLLLGGFSCKYISSSRGNPLKNTDVRRLLKMSVPLFFSSSVQYINEQVNLVLVSGLETGTVTAQGYAAVLSNLITTFIITFCSVIFIYLTSAISKNEHKKVADMAADYTKLLLLAFLPICIIAILCSEDIVTIVFGRGAFDAKSIRVASAALKGYSFAFLPVVVREIFGRICYGYGDSKSPAISSTVGILTNLVLSIMLCPVWGVFGVTLSSSISAVVIGIMNYLYAKRYNKLISIRPVLKVLPYMFAGSTLCCLTVLLIRCSFEGSGAIVVFALSCLGGLTLYLISVLPVLLRILRTIKAEK